MGAVLALELARHGVRSVVVERAPWPSVHPKMDFINGRSMELLRRLGLVEQIRAVGIEPRHSTDFLWTRGFHEPPVLVWHQPSVDQLRRQYATINDGTAPAEPYQRVQGSLLERLLRDTIRAHPLIDLREGWTFTDLDQDTDGVHARVVDHTTKTRHTISARFLVACDGARSTVRRWLDIPMDQAGEPTQYCSVYFRSRDPILRRHGRAFLTFAAKGLTLVSRDEDEVWTASMPIPPGVPMVSDPIATAQERLGARFDVIEVMSVAQWEGSLAVARNYRRGSVFLAGDSAHHYYPAGAHGVNTGIGDAVDLGWKLAAVTSGWGGPRLLDSYERERRPVAILNRELCADLLEVMRRFSRLAELGAPREQLSGILEQEKYQIDNVGVHFGHRYFDSPVIEHEPGDGPRWDWHRITPSTWPGGRAPTVRLASGEQILDRFGSEFTLVDLSAHEVGAPLVMRALDRGIPMTHLALDDPAVRACWERELVLVRPDQHVAWRSNAAPPDWDRVLDLVTGQPVDRSRECVMVSRTGDSTSSEQS